MSREAMKQALEALRTLHDENMDYLTRNNLGGENNQCMVFARETITALRQALETEQEPVAWRFRSGTWFNREVQWRYIDTLDGAEGLRGLQPLYTAPRQWQGLTDEEINSVCYKRDWTAPWTDTTFARAIEAKLREKNHG